MEIRFIINPISGTGKQNGITNLISDYFENYDIIYTKKKGDATELSQEAVKKGLDVVVAVGGDGTVNECAKALINSNTALAVIPCGSGNGFARHIGMNNNLEKAIIQLKNAKIQKIDSCTVNNMPFINVAGIGFDAHIADLFANLNTRGFLNYIRLIIKELNYQGQEYNIKYNGIEREIKAYMISFANSSQYGNNARISPMANIQDGLIDFVIVKNFPKWKIPIFLLKLITGNISTSEDIEIIQCDTMKINSKNKLIHLDGEPYKERKNITISLLHKSLKILIPNEKE